MRMETCKKSFLFFVLRAAVVAAVLLAAVAALNYSVDASLMISSRSYSQMAKLALGGQIVAVPENYNDRVYQMAIIDHMSVMPETVVIGSSRGMFLGREITGFEDIYNNCVVGACLEDDYALISLYRQRFSALPKRVIVETSPWVFYGDNPEQRWYENRSYEIAGNRLYKSLNGKKPLKIGKPENPFFSVPYFQYNFTVLKEKGADAFKEEAARVSDDPSEKADYPDGTIRYAAEKENASSKRLKKVQSAKGAVKYENVQDMTEIDPDKRKAYENLLQFLRKNGVEVIIYLQPFSITQCRYSFDENLNSVFRDVEEYLHRFGRENGIRIIGSYDARNYPLVDDSFIDYMHLDREGTRILWSADAGDD